MYVKHYLRPQFKQLGKGGAFFKPQYLKLFGSHISVDDFPTIIGARDANVQLTSWNIGDWKGCLLYTSPSPRDDISSRMPSSA